MYPAAGNELQWWRDLITPNIEKNEEQLLFLFTGKNTAKASYWADQKGSSYLLILYTYEYDICIHSTQASISFIIMYSEGSGAAPGVLVGLGRDSCQHHPIAATKSTWPILLPPRCPADTGTAKFPWGGHFWQGAGMKPPLGSPWLSGCYLSPNSCWSNAGWEEWPAGTGAVATTCPKLDPAGSHEVPMEEIEGLFPRRVSATTLSLETALSSFLYLNPFGLGINKLTKH